MKRELTVVCGAALLLTMAVAWPVVSSPTTHIFGNEIAGRQHDPFSVMMQFALGGIRDEYWQPLTDVPGAVLARAMGPVAAYNVIVLLSFPLTILATYALGRYLGGTRLGASVAAVAFGFAPVHLAHAAYHPHIAQTQWIPLYLLALFACVDRPTIRRALWLAAAATVLALSNFYAGLIGGVVTLVALPAYWFATGRGPIAVDRRLCVPLATLGVLAIAACAYVRTVTPQVWQTPRAFAAAPGDLVSYSAVWWAYLVPPVEHPILGAAARRIWTAVGVGPGLVEQQVSISWALLALAAVGIVAAVKRRSPFTRTCVLALIVIGVWAWLCSLAPHQTIAGLTMPMPSGVIAARLPMFRSYARFGIVVALITALLAGVGATRLATRPTRLARVALVLLLAMAAIDTLPLRWRTRDVLPTSAHRWVSDHLAGHPDTRALDCTAPSAADGEVPWLMHDQITLRSGALDDCTDPHVATTLAALGYTYVIVRGGPRRPLARQVTQVDGLRLVRTADDGQVFAVTAPRPIVATVDVDGFHASEGRDDDTWRWMGAIGTWRVINTSRQVITVQLQIDLQSFAHDRHVDIAIDQQPLAGVIDVPPVRTIHTIGPFALAPGEHIMAFRSVEPAEAPDLLTHNGDTRLITIRFGPSQWHVIAP